MFSSNHNNTETIHTQKREPKMKRKNGITPAREEKDVLKDSDNHP